MKGLLLSCLILTLSLATAAPNFKLWCSQGPNTAACIAAIKSDPRNYLKSFPTGAALILIDAAKANVVTTTAFIREKFRYERQEDVLGMLHQCMDGYNYIGDDLNFDLSSLDTEEKRRNATMTLDNISGNVTLSCEWYMLQHFPPVVQQIRDKVDRFANYLVSAGMFLWKFA